MRFLVDANLPRSCLPLLKGFGHHPEHARDIGLGGAPDADVAARVRATGAVLLTHDLDFANIHTYRPSDYPGIVVLRLPDDAVAEQIVSVLERFLRNTELVNQVPQHLVIVEPSRVRFRPPLTE